MEQQKKKTNMLYLIAIITGIIVFGLSLYVILK
jgi:hypothetical protein